MATSPKPAPAASSPRYLSSHELKVVEYARTEYRFTPSKAVTIDDLLNPRGYAHIAEKLRPGDIIEAVASDYSWYARLLVRHVAPPEVFLSLLSESKFSALPAKQAAE